MDPAHGLGELVGGGVFQEIARGAAFKRPTQVAAAAKGGDDDDPAGEALLFDLLQQLEAGHLGHLDVGEDNIGLVLLDLGQGLAAIDGGGDDLDVVLEIEQSGERAQYQPLILGDEDGVFRLGV